MYVRECICVSAYMRVHGARVRGHACVFFMCACMYARTWCVCTSACVYCVYVFTTECVYVCAHVYVCACACAICASV